MFNVWRTIKVGKPDEKRNQKNQEKLLLTAQYMLRPRVAKILHQAMSSKLVYIIAGAGYGKTQATHDYISMQADPIVCWVQVTEEDNIGSRFWEYFTRSISFFDPELAQKLRDFGFPETLGRFKKFVNMLEHADDGANRKIFVIDDFHHLQSEQILTFVKRCVHSAELSDLHMIIISRTEPKLLSETDYISYIASGKLSVMTEDELSFTEEEIGDFLKLRNIEFPPEKLPLFFEATKGWALGIQLLSLVLSRAPSNLGHALKTVKQNIFAILEEVFNDFSESSQKAMVRLALISDTSQMPMEVIVEDKNIILNIPKLASFVWLDRLSNEYQIHPLYLEFLQEKHHLLMPEEKKDTYYRVAKWCYENHFYMDAMNYFAKSNQYEKILNLLLSYPFKLPADTCEYFYNILEEIEHSSECADLNVLLLKNFFIPLLLLGMGKYDEARERTFEIIKGLEKLETLFAFRILQSCYSNLAYIDMYTCTVTHRYDAPKYLKKSIEYFKKVPTPPKKVGGPFAVADIRSFACLVGVGAKVEEFDQFIEASKETALYIEETYHDMYYGYEDLVNCEIAFYKNQLEDAKNHAHKAIIKAREKNQYSIEAMAIGYLLRISTYEGDYSLAKELIKQLEKQLENTDFWNRQAFYDLLTGNFYTQIGVPEKVASWLMMNEREAAVEVRTPTEELIVSVRTYIALQKYGLALTVLHNSYPRIPQEQFLFGELILTLLRAVAKVNSEDGQGAIKDFEKAYSLSFEGAFEMPFIELGKNIHSLVTLALKEEKCKIPKEWLKRIDRKASAFGKKTNIILEAFNREHNIDYNIKLSVREQEVLTDLYHGLSREEIAESRYLSVNTVKKILQSIYVKLDANNNVDAIRIAIEKNLLK